MPDGAASACTQQVLVRSSKFLYAAASSCMHAVERRNEEAKIGSRNSGFD